MPKAARGLPSTDVSATATDVAAGSTTSAPVAPVATLAARVASLDFFTPAFGCADGYGSSAEQIALALERANLPIRLVGLTRTVGTISASSIWQGRSLAEGDAIAFYSQPPSWLRQIGRRGYGFGMYESDQLPESWTIGIRSVDEVWVPSQWQVDPFERVCGTPVHVIPLGVDGKRFAYKRRVRGDVLTFLHFTTDATDRRKGADLAVRAFVAAFPGRSDVRLVMRSTIPGQSIRPDPRVEFVYGIVTPAQLLADYHAADALLHPARAEGFGLVPLEAMASGMPAIYANATGPADYGSFGQPVSSQRVPSPEFGGHWFEPNLEALVESMREIDANYDAVMDRAALDAFEIRRSWSWDRTAAAIIARLNA